uniref:NADH-ubiquinone oxidoreductase chain 3 n=1 Tax=Zygnema circumcarinatum TaxID=35869 RepID=A0A6N0GXM1_ZYGCR|nr:NADH dehydrogenase subunit 3 [Zygnema circumcarinatum]
MEFAPISVYLIISLILSLILVGVSFLFSSSSNLAYPEKLSAYECGFDPFDDARSRFDIRFYLVSILFIIFGATVNYQLNVYVDACTQKRIQLTYRSDFFVSLGSLFEQNRFIWFLVYDGVFVDFNHRLCI